MKKIFLFTVVIVLFISCNTETHNLEKYIQNGDFTEAVKIIESKLQNRDKLSDYELEALQKDLFDIKSVQNEYQLTYDDIFNKLKTKILDLSKVDVEKWKEDYSLEYYIIDGQERYYNNCIFDLFQVNKEAAERAKVPERKAYDASEYPLETINAFETKSEFDKKINISFRYFQNTSIIPEQSVLKAWIPYVRENNYQSNVKLIHSNIRNTTISPKDYLTSMIYFEKKIDKKYNSNSEWVKYFTTPIKSWIKPIKKPPFVNDSTFLIQFIYEYESKAYYKQVIPHNIEIYSISDSNYINYTKETISNKFTPYLINLSKKIIGKETNNYLKAKKIYEWICNNIIWTDPKPVMGDYAEYTAKYKRGDCSAKSNLFISLCRINKIPARSQGGWIIKPGGFSAQHSWAQMYFEPFGWLPVDVTIGTHLIDNKDERLKYFYFGNCTPYHFIIYDDTPELFPEKKFANLYGGGAQLGAFEWKEGDLEPYIQIDSHIEVLAK